MSTARPARRGYRRRDESSSCTLRGAARSMLSCARCRGQQRRFVRARARLSELGNRHLHRKAVPIDLQKVIARRFWREEDPTRGKAARDLGAVAEDTISLYASLRGLVATKSQRDWEGWDLSSSGSQLGRPIRRGYRVLRRNVLARVGATTYRAGASSEARPRAGGTWRACCAA